MQTKNFKFISSVIVTLVVITLLMFFVYNKQKNIDNRTALHLVFAIDIIRHGDRTPISHLPHFSNHWLKHKKGVLTTKGQKESQELGKKLAQYYISQRSLLPKTYKEQDILIQTSKRQRTVDTAKNIMEGMYPEAKDIKITSPEINNPLLPDTYLYNDSLKAFHQNTSQKTIHEMKNAIREINKILKTDLTINDIGKIDDNIKVNEEHNITTSKKIPKELLTKLNVFGTIALINAMKSTELSCKAGLPLANNVITLLNEFTITHRQKYVLYITHDFMMWALLNLLHGSPIDTHPPYLANLRIELFQNTSKQLYIKLSYNNKVLKPCGTTFCKLNKFQTYINKNLQPCYNL